MRNAHWLSGVGKASAFKTAAAMFLLVVIPAVASAQSQSERRGWGYGFIAIGGTAGDGSTATLHYGGGGDRLIYRGLGLGASLENLAPITDLGQGLGIFSTTGSYHFRGRQSSRKMSPFISGGYSLKFRDDEDSGSGVNIGAGIQYWASDRVGVRVEFRDHHFFKGVLNFYAVRLGLAFR